MKYCSHCGSEIMEEAVICVKCGCPVAVKRSGENETMKTFIQVLLILTCIFRGLLLFLIPLAWCLPMTVSVFKSFRENRPVSTGMKVCVLLFVSLIAGICLLCMKDD